MNSTHTYPLTPSKDGVQNSSRVQKRHLGYWVPAFAGMIGLVLSACSQPNSAENKGARIVEPESQELVLDQTAPDICLNRGYKVDLPVDSDVELTRGMTKEDVSEIMSSHGYEFNSTIVGSAWGPSPCFDNELYARTYHTLGSYCKIISRGNIKYIQALSTSFDTLKISNECVHEALKKVNEFNLYELSEVSKKRDVAAKFPKDFGLDIGIAIEDVDTRLSELGFELSQINTFPCEGAYAVYTAKIVDELNQYFVNLELIFENECGENKAPQTLKLQTIGKII